MLVRSAELESIHDLVLAALRPHIVAAFGGFRVEPTVWECPGEFHIVSNVDLLDDSWVDSDDEGR